MNNFQFNKRFSAVHPSKRERNCISETWQGHKAGKRKLDYNTFVEPPIPQSSEEKEILKVH